MCSLLELAQEISGIEQTLQDEHIPFQFVEVLENGPTQGVPATMANDRDVGAGLSPIESGLVWTPGGEYCPNLGRVGVSHDVLSEPERDYLL